MAHIVFRVKYKPPSDAEGASSFALHYFPVFPNRACLPAGCLEGPEPCPGPRFGIDSGIRDLAVLFCRPGLDPGIQLFVILYRTCLPVCRPGLDPGSRFSLLSSSDLIRGSSFLSSRAPIRDISFLFCSPGLDPGSR